MEEKIAETVEKARPAIAALKNYQQADMDGIVVTVSRQAVHEVADAFEVIAQALSGICVEVALEWEEFFLTQPDGVKRHHWNADTPFNSYYQVRELPDGQYSAELIGHTDGLRWPEFAIGLFETGNAAMGACQRDFASRISPCLKTRTVEEVRAEALEWAADQIEKMWVTCPAEAAACLRSLQEGKDDA